MQPWQIAGLAVLGVGTLVGIGWYFSEPEEENAKKKQKQVHSMPSTKEIDISNIQSIDELPLGSLPFNAPKGFRWHLNHLLHCLVLVPSSWEVIEEATANGFSVNEVKAERPSSKMKGIYCKITYSRIF
jgi:hypothetical protein